MTSSISKLTAAFAVAALLALPGSAAGQAPPSQPPATAQPPASGAAQQPASTPQDTTSQTPSIAQAREHLAKAKAALDEVNTDTLDARAKSQVTDLNRRINALERSVAANDSASATGTANRDPKATSDARGNVNWGTEVGEIDKLLTTLLGPEAATAAAPPTPTGTSGKAAATGLDETARTKLMEVRTHLTAFATAMVGGQVKTPAPATDPTTDPNAAAKPPASPQPTGTTGTIPQQPTGTTGMTGQTAQQPAQTGRPDEQAARQHLTAARNTLSEITQLPAAAQLTGETRTQVSQLISNFNELITAQSEWRATYAKVTANLTALLGPEVGTPDPSGAPGTAVGTSGSPAASLDPEIRSRLTELRRQLSEFEKAAGGGAPAQSPATAANPAPTDPSAPPAAPPSTPPAAAPPSTVQPTAPTDTAPQGTTGAPAAPATGNAEIVRHIAAIEAMLKSEDDSGGVTLTKLQLEQLRAHLAGLRQAIEKR